MEEEGGLALALVPPGRRRGGSDRITSRKTDRQTDRQRTDDRGAQGRNWLLCESSQHGSPSTTGIPIGPPAAISERHPALIARFAYSRSPDFVHVTEAFPHVQLTFPHHPIDQYIRRPVDSPSGWPPELFLFFCIFHEVRSADKPSFPPNARYTTSDAPPSEQIAVV